MNCNICNNSSAQIFQTKVLNKHDVNYYQCDNCGFIQTEKPYWLQEAYNRAISDLDIGLVSRNLAIAPKADLITNLFFDANARFLDYGGGYGMLVRMMRDRGYDFYRQDIYCENLFAKNFDLADLEKNKQHSFELLCAFEVFEHLENPLSEIEKMFSYSKNILFSTELQPVSKINDPKQWWYFTPETGQHIALYSERSLQFIAQKFNIKYHKINNSFHLFSNSNIDVDKIKAIENNRLNRWLYYRFQYKRRASLLGRDFNRLVGRKVF